MSQKAEQIQRMRETASHSSAAWQAMDAVRLLAKAVKDLADTLGDDVEAEVVEAMLKLESAQAAAFVAAAKHLMGPSFVARA